MRVALRVLGVVPIDRDEEDVHMRLSRSDRLLLDSADSCHRSVELDLAGRCDLVAAIDVASSLLEQLESERQPGRGPADLAQVELDRERQLSMERLNRRTPMIGRFGFWRSDVVGRRRSTSARPGGSRGSRRLPACAVRGRPQDRCASAPVFRRRRRSRRPAHQPCCV
jgi:hypothetical protein